MRDETISLFIVTRRKYGTGGIRVGTAYAVYVGTEWEGPSWSDHKVLTTHGSSTEIPVHFDKLKDARDVVYFLASKYKSQGRTVKKDLRARRG